MPLQGSTGEIKFDNRGYRSNFTVDIIDLTSSGITKIQTWNTIVKKSRLNITRKNDLQRELLEESSMNNKTFIILTALVNSKVLLCTAVR